MHAMPRWAGVAAIAVAFAMAADARAQQPDPRSGRYLAANCANCHGTEGRSTGAVPSLAGRKKEYLLEVMRAYRDGKRSATVMQQLAKGYTDVQLELIADYFSSRPAK
jgi:cytochrome c553